MAKLTKLADKTNDAKFSDIHEILNEFIHQVHDGEIDPHKLIIAYQDSEGFHYSAAGVTRIEFLGLIEAVKLLGYNTE